MPYAGHAMMGRDVCTLGVKARSHDGKHPFVERKVELLSMLAGEAAFYVGAYHDNFPSPSVSAEYDYDRAILTSEDLEGRTVIEARREQTRLLGAATLQDTPTSRDCGLGEINILGKYIGTSVEASLRTESNDPTIYLPVAQHNLDCWADLYTEPWVFPDGKHEPRQWQASVAYRSGWALWPDAWVASRVTPGTWVQSGRFLPKAIRATANWWILERGMDPYDALALAERLASTYKIPTSTTYWLDVDPVFPVTDPVSKHKLVFWHYPPKPTEPPPADAPYPTWNDGRSYLTQLSAHG